MINVFYVLGINQIEINGICSNNPIETTFYKNESQKKIFNTIIIIIDFLSKC